MRILSRADLHRNHERDVLTSRSRSLKDGDLLEEFASAARNVARFGADPEFPICAAQSRRDYARVRTELLDRLARARR